jgi:hypothetical protein
MEGEHYNMVKGAIENWIDALLTNEAECAITGFSIGSYIKQEFTSNVQKLHHALDTFYFDGLTSYKAAFLNPYTGALVVAEKAKYKPVIIMVTDAVNTTDATDLIVQRANELGASIYCIVIDTGCPPPLQEIAERTGGKWYSKVESSEVAEQIYSDILGDEQKEDPCVIEWESEIVCKDEERQVEIYCKANDRSESFSYSVPNSGILNLEVEPNAVSFGKVTTGEVVNETIEITSPNLPVEITKIRTTDSRFSVSPQSLSLAAGETADLTVTYTAPDESYAFTKFIFETSICESYSYASAGMPSKDDYTLKVTQPNGGEKYIVGTDSIITWEGVFPETAARIHFSEDNGKSWNLLADSATNYKYIWSDLPGPASDSCLIRIQETPTEPLAIETSVCTGGSSADIFHKIIETTDGNYITVGSTESNDGTVTGNNGLKDIWICRWDKNLNLISSRCIGESDREGAYDITATSDGGYILIGTDNEGTSSNIRVIKLESDFSTAWSENYGGYRSDVGAAIIEAPDGGYYFVGSSSSTDGIFSGNHGLSDIVLFKIDADGKIENNICLGGSNSDYGKCLLSDNDGNIILAADSKSITYNEWENHGRQDVVLVKLDKEFNIIRQVNIGGSEDEHITGLIATKDGGYAIAIKSQSESDDFKENSGVSDAWIFKTDSDFNIIWSQSFAGQKNDYINSLHELENGNILVSGTTYSNDIDFSSIPENLYSTQAWVGIIGETGEKIRLNCYGGTNYDCLNDAILNSDNQIVGAGYSASQNNGIDAKYGGYDGWIMRLEEGRFLQTDVSDEVFSLVVPKCSIDEIDMQKCVVGKTKDSILTAYIRNESEFPCKVKIIHFSGDDAAAFTILSEKTNFILEPYEKRDIEIAFSPNSIMKYNASILMYTQAETLGKKVTGEGIPKRLWLESKALDFGTVNLLDSTRQYKRYVRSYYDKELIVDSLVVISETGEEYKVRSNSGPFSVNSGQTVSSDFLFKPTLNGVNTGELLIYYDYPDSPIRVGLTGNGIGTTVKVEDFEAASDERTTMTVSSDLLDFKRFKDVVDSYKMKLKFEKSLLYPLKPELVDEIKNDSTVIEITGNINPGSNKLAEIKMYAGLGSVSKTEIDIEDIIWYDKDNKVVKYDAAKESGTFRLSNLCYAGGTRLLEQTRISEDKMIEVSPNPAQDEITIKLNLVEKGYTEVHVSDILGREVKQIFKEDVSARGERTIKCNISELGTGQYYINFSSPGYKQSVNLQIVR